MAHPNAEDRMTLAGVKIYPRIGITPEERSAPQECSADLTLWGNFEAAAIADDLNLSVDYCAVLSITKKIAEERDYNLLETLAYSIVRAVLRNFPVARVRVRVRKRPGSLSGDLDHVEVEVEET